MTTFYTIHDVKRNSTSVVSSHGAHGFVMDSNDDLNLTSSDIMFAVDNYGPQMVNGRYLITMQSTSDIQ